MFLAVGLWAGWGVGTVDVITCCFFFEICRLTFFRAAVAWPTEADWENACQWVEEKTCASWWNGWLML